MKSFSFTSLIGVIAATSVLLLSSEVQLQAQNGNGAVRPYVGNFVNNGTFLEVSNSTPYIWNTASNIVFYNYGNSQNVLASTVQINTSTNGSTIFTNSIFTYPPAIVDVPIYPDLNGDYSANTALTITVGITNNYQPYPANYSPTQVGSGVGSNTNVLYGSGTNYCAYAANATNTTSYYGVASTNLDTFVFATSADGENCDSGWVGSQHVFTFSFGSTNNTVITFTTNLPTSFLQGAMRVRLMSITPAQPNSQGAGVLTIDKIAITGVH